MQLCKPTMNKGIAECGCAAYYHDQKKKNTWSKAPKGSVVGKNLFHVAASHAEKVKNLLCSGTGSNSGNGSGSDRDICSSSGSGSESDSSMESGSDNGSGSDSGSSSGSGSGSDSDNDQESENASENENSYTKTASNDGNGSQSKNSDSDKANDMDAIDGDGIDDDTGNASDNGKGNGGESTAGEGDRLRKKRKRDTDNISERPISYSSARRSFEKPQSWFVDDVVSFFSDHCVRANEAKGIYVCYPAVYTLFYVDNRSDEEKVSALPSTFAESGEPITTWLIPCNVGGTHWALVRYDVPNRLITVWDSMFGDSTRQLGQSWHRWLAQYGPGEG